MSLGRTDVKIATSSVEIVKYKEGSLYKEGGTYARTYVRETTVSSLWFRVGDPSNIRHLAAYVSPQPQPRPHKHIKSNVFFIVDLTGSLIDFVLW